MDDVVANLTFSSIACLVSRTVTFPLDTIKTRTQNSGSRQVGSSNGISSYFKGLPVTLMFSVPATAVYLSTYEESKARLSVYFSKESFVNHAISAAYAEGVSGVLFTPMEVLKQKMQVGSMTLKDTCIDTYRNYGWRGFYRGYWLSQAVFIPYTISYFVTYEKLKSLYSENTTLSYIICSSLSAALAGAISNPMDVVKTRVQIASNQQTSKIIEQVYRENGWRGFTRGMMARIAWVAPSMTITITIFELLKDYHTSHKSRR